MNPSFLLHWLPLLPAAALMLAALVVPGTVFLLLVRARSTAALAGGPLLTAALLGGGGFVLGSLGIAYGWPGFLLLVAALWLLGLLLRLAMVRAGSEPAPSRGDLRTRLAALRDRRTLLLLGAGLVTLAVLWLPLGLLVDPQMPSPKVDPMYHYNVLNAVGETGNISLNSAVDFNYGLRVGHVMYPTVWHALAALGVPLAGIIPAANAFAYLVTPAVFVGGIALFARVVFRRGTVATVAAVLAAGALPAFPTGMLLVRAFWPNALATALLPGLLVMMILFLRRVRWSRLRRRPRLMALDALVMIAAGLGLGATHPSVLASALVMSLPLLLAAALKAEGIVRRTLPPRTHRLFVAVLVAVPVVLIVLALIPRRVRSYVLRSGEQAWDALLLKGVSLLVNWPTDVSHLAGIVVALVYLPLLLGGLVVLARTRGRRWIPAAWLLGAALVAGSYVPLPVLSGVSGLWYGDTYRLFAVQAVLLPLAVAALVEHAREARPRRTAVAESAGATEETGTRPRWRRLELPAVAALLVCALLGSTYITAGAARQVGVGAPEQRPLADEAELELLERIGEELPEGSVVIGDPASGVAYLPLESEVESVFTQVNLRDVDGDGIFLAENFDEIHEDPRVCQLLEHYGIGYFYEDADLSYNYTERSEATPGFYAVDTSEGFTLVDEADTAKLWRIDACGEIDPPEEWWQRSFRGEAIVQNLDEGAGDPSRSPE